MFNQFGGPFDPDFTKNLYEQWEKMISQQLENLVKDESFVREMSKALAATMSGKSMGTKMMDETMASMNLPTRSEIIKLSQKVADLEEKLIDLNEKSEDILDELAEIKKSLTAKPAAAKPAAAKPAAAAKNSKKTKK